MIRNYRINLLAVLFLLSPFLFSQNRKLDSLKNLVKTTKNDSLKLQALIDLSRLCSKQGFPNDGLKYGRQALKICYETGKTEKMAYTNTQLGANFLALNNIDSGSVYYNNALNIYRSIGDTINVSNVYNNLGLIKYYETDYNGALKYYLISLKIKEDVKDSSKLGWNYNAIGTLYLETGNSTKALDFFTKALTLSRIRKNEKGYIEATGNIAGIYRDKGEYNKALSLFKEILSIILKKDEETFLAETYDNIASTYLRQKKYDLSLLYFKNALDVALRHSNQRVAAFSFIGLARSYKGTGNVAEAIKNCYGALAITEKLKINDARKIAFEELYKNYKKTNVDSALNYYEKYIEIEKTILNEGNQAELAKMEERYENEKKMAISNVNHAKEIELEKEKSKNQKTISYFFILVVILVTAFLFVIYKRLQLTRKQKEIINIQKKEVEDQKSLVDEKQKEIVDSINYAKRIQYTLLAHEQNLKENLKDHFVLFKPKDIVSGDFYWATKKGERFFLAVCDCTGHGVPGAFMSLLNISFLNEAINEKNISEPNEVFNHVRKRLIENISQNGGQDGMDGILICFDTKNNKLTYAAANNAPILINSGSIHELSKDKMPVGKGERTDSFSLNTIDIKTGDTLYLYTDGFPDQFGGPKGKKYKYKQLNSELHTISKLPLKDQVEILTEKFKDWKGQLEQVDDVCVIGIKF